MILCIYAPGSWGDCFDLGCSARGGRCEYVGPPGRNACPCKVGSPSPNRGAEEEAAMPSALQTYRTAIEQQPPCSEEWFPDALVRARAGDDGARRRILGCSLRLALAQ